MDDSQALTWNQLVKLEPRLGQLHLDCRFADRRDPNGFNADAVWNGTSDTPGLKNRLELLVGQNAEVQDPMIQSVQAYNLASTECRQALPPDRPGIGQPDVRTNLTADPSRSA
jgi:hypothetical protein